MILQRQRDLPLFVFGMDKFTENTEKFLKTVEKHEKVCYNTLYIVLIRRVHLPTYKVIEEREYHYEMSRV